MTATLQTRAISTSFGLVMVAAAAVQADDAALIAAGLAALAVLAGTVIRPGATLAVLLTAAAIALDDALPMLAALCGVSAAGYLVLRHTATATAPTVIGAAGCTAVALAAVSLPVQLPWAPLVAPLAVLTLVVLVTRPFWADRSRGQPQYHSPLTSRAADVEAIPNWRFIHRLCGASAESFEVGMGVR